MTDRRQTFREFMNRFDPKGDPAGALQQGFYVEPPTATARQIGVRLAIDPSSSHVIVGGVGTGKTTELRVLNTKILEDATAFYLDVPSEHKLSKLRVGVLLALTWIRLSGTIEKDNLPDDAKEIFAAAERSVAGYWTELWDAQDDPGDYVKMPGILESPEKDKDINQIIDGLRVVLAASGLRCVMLFDGLDRAKRSEVLVKMIARDIKALEGLGIGTVLVAPPDLQLDLNHQIAERFSGFHFHLAADFLTPEGREFLSNVLRNRSDHERELLTNEAMDDIVRFSGGILRDLIALARDSAEFAYAEGADNVGPTHVAAAADRLGRLLLLGISTEMAKRLTELRPGPFKPKTPFVQFTMAGQADIDLLVRRLLVQLPGPIPRFVLHPAILPLLAGLPKS